MSDITWMKSALCIGKDTDWFFPESGVAGYAKQVAEVKSFCRRCKVAQQCLDYAIANDERFGLWGGLTKKERNQIAMQRKITVKEVNIRTVKKDDSKV